MSTFIQPRRTLIPDEPHYAGAGHLLHRFDVRSVSLAPFWHYTGTPGYHAIINAIDAKAVPVRFIAGYERVYPDSKAVRRPAREPFDRAYADAPLLELLGPPNGVLNELRRADKLDPNHLSVMAVLSWNRFRMVFAADAQMENWSHFDHEGMLECGCDVLKAAHHGSCRGTQWERLERLSPKHVIVSSDPSLRDHLPDAIGAATLGRYAKHRIVGLTSMTGSIRVTVDECGAHEVVYFGDSRHENVDLAAAKPLTRASNPTDWSRLLTESLAPVA